MSLDCVSGFPQCRCPGLNLCAQTPAQHSTQRTRERHPARAPEVRSCGREQNRTASAHGGMCADLSSNSQTQVALTTSSAAPSSMPCSTSSDSRRGSRNSAERAVLILPASTHMCWVLQEGSGTSATAVDACGAGSRGQGQPPHATCELTTACQLCSHPSKAVQIAVVALQHATLDS